MCNAVIKMDEFQAKASRQFRLLCRRRLRHRELLKCFQVEYPWQLHPTVFRKFGEGLADKIRLSMSQCFIFPFLSTKKKFSETGYIVIVFTLACESCDFLKWTLFGKMTLCMRTLAPHCCLIKYMILSNHV
jgi:hypothetical protein